MKSLLNALQEGRLIELPTVDKDKALEYLAVLIEAIPDIGASADLVGEIKAREQTANTAIGMGVACPHARTSKDGELLCAVGWSPEGIEYGAPDGRKVHLLVMYFIPDTQRHVYLKEISGLAKAIKASDGIEDIINAPDLATVRHQLLDWVNLALDAALPDAKARMIQLEAKATALPEAPRMPFLMVPFSLLLDDGRQILLAQDAALVKALEREPELGEQVRRSNDFQLAGYRILTRAATTFAGGRQLFECLAVRPEGTADAAPVGRPV